MHDILTRFAEICSQDNVLRTGLLAGLLFAGAAGSIMHCGPMCGAFVLGQISDRMARLQTQQFCELRRINIGLLLPYHLGRITTYATLGALAAGSVSILGGSAPWMRYLSTTLLLAAATIFLLHAIAAYMPSIKSFANTAWFARVPIGRIARNIPRGTAAGEYLLGVALGFLPCGFLYAALLVAAGTGNPLMGAAAMATFGLGTAPVLMIIGIAGQAAGRRWNRTIQAAAPIVMTLNALLLLTLAWQRLA